MTFRKRSALEKLWAQLKQQCAALRTDFGLPGDTPPRPLQQSNIYATVGQGAEAPPRHALCRLLTPPCLQSKRFSIRGAVFSIDRGRLGPKMIDFLSQAKASWHEPHETIVSMPLAKEATKIKRGDARVAASASGGALNNGPRKAICMHWHTAKPSIVL